MSYLLSPPEQPLQRWDAEMLDLLLRGGWTVIAAGPTVSGEPTYAFEWTVETRSGRVCVRISRSGSTLAFDGHFLGSAEVAISLGPRVSSSTGLVFYDSDGSNFVSLGVGTTIETLATAFEYSV